MAIVAFIVDRVGATRESPLLDFVGQAHLGLDFNIVEIRRGGFRPTLIKKAIRIERVAFYF
jgi:hypothetical protein